ncbi:MAG: hypothetical protein DDG58_12120 [Ardenticatenia bacterium]|nr:MAG: hypothetical protein DDG58_12120 [Ardenticatenia bacterium]
MKEKEMKYPAHRWALMLALALPTLWLIGLVWALADSAPGATAASVRYVKRDATGACNGTSWTNAYTDPQQAIDAASPGDEIWVARGVYTPTKRTNPADPRSATFQLKEGIALYGGFAGTETVRTQRNWTTNVTVLSGDLDNNDTKDANGVVITTTHIHGANAYHVVTATNVTSNTVLDGFTISAGFTDNFGGGMDVVNASPVIRHCAFRGNQGQWGGGMSASDSSLSLTDVTFSGNHAGMSGGGMDTRDSSLSLIDVIFSGNQATWGGGMDTSDSSLSLTDVIFSGNQATWGGGMDTSDSSLSLTDVIFSGNQADSGGGMSNYKSNVILTQATFDKNGVTWYGGGIDNDQSYLTMTQVTFSDNHSARYGGGMYNEGGSHVNLNRVALTGNRADIAGGGMHTTEHSHFTATNVLLSGNQAPRGGAVAITDRSSGRMVNVTMAGNRATLEGGAVCVLTWSHTTLINAILWGNAATTGAQVHLAATSTVTITTSDVEGSWPGTGNINANPLFVAPVAATYAPTTTGNYRLQASSPAIDQGDNAAVPAGVTTDLDGKPRIVGAAVDMGAYERQRSTVYLPVVRR